MRFFPWARKRQPPNTKWLIVGLGNPGSKYAVTRHNVGFMVVTALVEGYGIPLKKKTLAAHWGTGKIEGEAVVLAQPTTYMNQSGRAVAQLLHYFKLTPEALVVIHDDLDVPAGRLKLAQGGGAGGHRGVQSIMGAVNSREFYRVKVGIGRPPPVMSPEDFVLSSVARADWETLVSLVDCAAQAVVTLITETLLAAQSRFHGTASPPLAEN